MRNARHLYGVAAIALLIVASRAFSAGPEHVTSVEGIAEYRLDNGLRLLLFPDPSRPVVTVNLTIVVGSRHEGYGESGMAHLLEHMLFKRTPSYPDIKKALTDRGARWNGSTWLDRTNYFETLTASDENLEFAVRLEAERLTQCPIEAEDLASEMSVVRNEFEIGENNPVEILLQRMQAAAYEWHNYGKTTIGNRSDIERVPAVSLRRFYQRYYQPDNAMLIVAGRFDQPKALQLVEKWLGAIPKPERVLEATYTEEPAQDGERTVSLRRVGDVAMVAVLYHVPAGPDEEFPAVRSLQAILSDSPSGRLYKSMVETNKAAAVFGDVPPLHDPGYLTVAARVRDDQSLDEARRVMLDTIEQVAQGGVTAEEVDRVKAQFAAQRRRELDDSSRLAVALSNWAAQGDWRLYFLMRDRMEKVTPEQVGGAAKKYLRASNRTVGVYFPTREPDRTPVPPAPDVAVMLKDYQGREAVSPGEVLDPDPMTIESHVTRQVLPGGVKAALWPKKSRQETVYLRLVLHYGNEQNLKDMAAACEMLPQLMIRGTQQLSRQQLKDSLDRLEARLMVDGNPGSVTFDLQAPRKNLAESLGLMRQVMREPSLPEAEFDILKRQNLASYESISKDPETRAGYAIRRKFSPYPQGDPRYQPTVEEEIQRLSEERVDRIRRLYSEYLGAQAAELAMVGQFDPNETLPAVVDMLQGWEAPMPYARLTYRAVEGLAASTELIETPDKANAVYLAGLAWALDDLHPDYPALVMAGRVLGGSGSARLLQRVREKEGLSYGVGARFSARSLDPEARLDLFAVFSPGTLDRTKQAILEELQKLATQGVAAEELNREREAYLKSRSMARTQDASLAAMLREQLHVDRTMKDEAELEEKILALGPEQVSAAVRKYFDPAKLVVVVAGDFAATGPQEPTGKAKR